MPKTRVWVSGNGIPHTIDDRNRCLTFGHGCPCVEELHDCHTDPRCCPDCQTHNGCRCGDESFTPQRGD